MRPALWISAVLVALACDREGEPSATAPTAMPDDASASIAANTPKAVPTSDPAPTGAARLDVDDRLPPLSTRAADGTEACGTCRAGDGPRLVVFASVDGIGRGETWRDLDAIARLYADNGLGALAIITKFANGRAIAVDDAEATARGVATLQKSLGVVMPVDVAIARATTDGRGLGEIDAITQDPTVVLVEADGRVSWTGGVGAHWRELDLAIARVLAGA